MVCTPHCSLWRALVNNKIKYCTCLVKQREIFLKKSILFSSGKMVYIFTTNILSTSSTLPEEVQKVWSKVVNFVLIFNYKTSLSE